MKPKPDDRSDNVKKIQFNINNTIRNMELAEEMMAKSDNSDTKAELEAKNERRRAALDSMRSEIREEALHKNKKH